VMRPLAPCDRGLAGRLDLPGGTVARIREPRVDEALGVVTVDRAALALAIRRVGPLLRRPLDARALVPIQAEPAQVFQDPCLGARYRPLPVRVLDPEHERAAVLAGEKPVQHRDARVPHVQAAGRAGGEAGAYH